MKRELNKIVGLRIKRARENAGLTQETLAELADRTKEAISNVERGVNLPSLETLNRICEITNVNIGMMLEDTDRSPNFVDLKMQIDLHLLKLTENELKLLLTILDAISEQRKDRPI
ncbi:helix-turn-helix domain-containing protein [Methylobacterium dankookense]|uniref:HTH cro/C1-type domain-containing protein n=1 Tax=Methylobacterium dankookense TaxID=560405 RepID=A0A564FZG7_9HYPH|nr:helix-turn-helix transcriptional regulator [Methylobacterium dankookense]GJD57069.1 hypothetical protein IFDJLNFL_2969 [Methylobacterium dankookense]VUF13573.1 hypothetical protein MTDSW087_03280 [Methylobacterium dankookense]